MAEDAKIDLDERGGEACERRARIIQHVIFAVAFVSLLVVSRDVLHWLRYIFTEPREDMAHGWIVPLFSIAILWMRRKELAAAVGRPSILGLLGMLPGLLMYWVGTRGDQIRITQLAMIWLLWFSIYAVYGRKLAKLLVFPVAFLLFTVPLGFLDAVTVKLRFVTTVLASGLLNGIGIPVIRNGTGIHCLAGDGFNLDVADPCSGLRSIFALTALTAAYAYMTQKTVLKKWILFFCSVPLAVLGNIARIFSIAVVANFCGQEAATGFYHDYSGYVVFLVAILAMMQTATLLSRKGRSKKEKVRSNGCGVGRATAHDTRKPSGAGSLKATDAARMTADSSKLDRPSSIAPSPLRAADTQRTQNPAEIHGNSQVEGGRVADGELSPLSSIVQHCSSSSNVEQAAGADGSEMRRFRGNSPTNDFPTNEGQVIAQEVRHEAAVVSGAPSHETAKPQSPDAPAPQSPDAPAPQSPDAPKPSSPDAQMLKCSNTQMPTRASLVLAALVPCLILALGIFMRSVPAPQVEPADFIVSVLPPLKDYRAMYPRFCQNENCGFEIESETADAPIGLCPKCGSPMSIASLGENNILPDDTGFRKCNYYDAMGDVYRIAIVINGQSRQSIHRPEVCLPTQGFSMENGHEEKFTLDNGEVLGLRCVDLRRYNSSASSRMGQGYFLVSAREHTASHRVRLLASIRDRVFSNKVSRWAMVTIFCEESLTSSPERIEDVGKFLSQFYPAIFASKEFRSRQSATLPEKEVK